jgi:hypothetical protein
MILVLLKRYIYTSSLHHSIQFPRPLHLKHFLFVCLQRNRSFRDAFGIKSDDERIQYASAFLDQVIHLDLVSFVPKVEKTLADFIAARNERTKNLLPMPQNQRWLVHQLAVYYGLDTESYDKEPRRTVRLVKSKFTIRSFISGNVNQLRVLHIHSYHHHLYLCI